MFQRSGHYLDYHLSYMPQMRVIKRHENEVINPDKGGAPKEWQFMDDLFKKFAAINCSKVGNLSTNKVTLDSSNYQDLRCR